MNPGDAEPSGETRRLSEASDWLVRLHEASVTEADVAAWLKWCAADGKNLETFERMQRLHDQLQSLPMTDKQEFLRLQNGGKTRAIPQAALWRFAGQYSAQSWIRGSAAVAAGIAVAAVVITWNSRSPPMEAREYQAPQGAEQALLLADRSRVTLASASEILSHFTPDRRYVDLREGEAYFEVQPDHSRPFVVKAGAMTVTAVGTKFSVRRAGSQTIVAVTEGAVDVANDQVLLEPRTAGQSAGNVAEAPAIPVRVRAGQQAVGESAQSKPVVSDISPAEVNRWRQGRLEYVMAPLSSVVADVNRYGSHQIVINGPGLGDLVFTGTVFIDRIDDWAMTLPSAFPVFTSVAPDGTITLGARNSDQQTGFR